MVEKTINSPAELHELASSFRKTHPIFRGVSDASFQLVSRFGRSIIKNREFRKKNASFSYVVDSTKEEIVLEKFKNISAPYLAFQPKNDWEWLAIAQHHGLPTRMMDWTTNPLVAAYFATTHNPSTSDSAIYVINDRYNLDRAQLDQSPYKLNKAMIFSPRHATQRITSQSGLFIVPSKIDEPFSCEGLEKWVLTKNCHIEIEIMLCRYGITPASMFPGLDGIANSLVRDYGL